MTTLDQLVEAGADQQAGRDFPDDSVERLKAWRNNERIE